MIAERTLYVLVLIAAAGGCSSTAGSSADARNDALPADASPDAPPTIDYVPFTSKTWSLSMTGGAAQLSITDGGGAAACALSGDQQRSLGAAGVQIIMQLPGTVTGPCPAGGYSLATHCAATLGSGAYVTAGCAFYRQWDAQGVPVGIRPAIDGVITIAGDENSCSIRTSITFLGNSFNESFVLMNGVGMQPWCREG